MFVVFVLALSQDCILIMYLHCFSLASLMYIDALMFMLMQCTYMTGKHLIFSPFAPDLASLSFLLSFSQLQTIFWSLFCRFVMMTKHKNLSSRFLSRAKILPGNMQTSALLPSPLMTPRPGRNESPQRRMAKHF